MPLVETPGVLSPKARAKLLRKSIYEAKRQEAARLKAEKAATQQAERDAALAPLLDAYLARVWQENEAEAAGYRGFGFG